MIIVMEERESREREYNGVQRIATKRTDSHRMRMRTRMERILGRRLIVSSCNWFGLRVIVREAISKSNHPVQNPLLLVTEPRTRDTVLTSLMLSEDKKAHEEHEELRGQKHKNRCCRQISDEYDI
jgi:hypothetical protein